MTLNLIKLPCPSLLDLPFALASLLALPIATALARLIDHVDGRPGVPTRMPDNFDRLVSRVLLLPSAGGCLGSLLGDCEAHALGVVGWLGDGWQA